MRQTTVELQRARLELNTPDGFAISKDVIRSLIDEVIELREAVCDTHDKALELAAEIVEREPACAGHAKGVAAKIRARKA